MGKKVKMTNNEIDNCLESLSSLLDLTGMVGYIAALNTSRLQDAIVEYHKIKDSIIQKYGVDDVDEHGNPVKRIDKGTPEWDKFVAEIEPIAAFEHEVELESFPARDACNVLTGRQLLNLKWMLVFDGTEPALPGM